VDSGSLFGNFWFSDCEFDHFAYLPAADWPNYLPIFAAKEKGVGRGA
jgi:hypothetical protein